MPRDPDRYDLFVSYARRDNATGWITGFVEELLVEHRKFTGGRSLSCFFDTREIRGFDDWRERIYHGLAASRLFLAFVSPRYFASDWCRREWRAWIDTEIAKHILSNGAAPIYIIEVPGLDNEKVGEEEVARKVAELCDLPEAHAAFVDSVSALIKQLRRRHLSSVRSFYKEGLNALRREDLRLVLTGLATDLEERVERVRTAADSESTVPPYNKRFSGRLDELLDLRERLKDDRAGVIAGVHGLGGIGKTELAFTYAHAFASAYPGGRFLVPCEGKSSLRDAALHLGDLFCDRIADEDRKLAETYFAAITACLRERLGRLGHILLVLDNVTDPALLTAQQTDALTALGPKLHLLATTRLGPPAGAKWLTLGELSEAEALELLEKHRPFADEAEEVAGRRLVRRLGGFALAVELVAGWFAAHPTVTCASFLDRLGLEDLEALDALAQDRAVELRRHNQERRVRSVLGPVLADLKPVARRAMDYAALLPPDQVPLPWLGEMVREDFPELAGPLRPGYEDPWEEAWRSLEALALVSRATPDDQTWRDSEPGEGGTSELRVARVHRLVQDLVRRAWSAEEASSRQQALERLVERRVAALERVSRWDQVRWELEPLDGLAWLWADADRAKASWLLQWVGQRWYLLAEWTRAEPLLRRALAIGEASLGPGHAQVATSLNNLALLLQDTNRLAEAEPLLRRALVIAVASFGEHQPEVATILHSLSVLLRDTNRLAEAELLQRRALAINQASHGAQHPEVAMNLDHLALLLRLTNRLAEAEPLQRRALAISEASLGPEHPEVAASLNNLAVLLVTTDRLAEAERVIRRALAISEASYGPDHPNVATNLGILGGVLQTTDRLVEAEILQRRALAIRETSYGPNHPKVAASLQDLARLLVTTDRLAEAEPLLRRSMVINEASYGPAHPNVVICLNKLAGLLQDTNRPAEAEPLLRRSLAIDEASYGPDHPNVVNTLLNLALLLQDTNQLAEAERLLRRVPEILFKFEASTGTQYPNRDGAIRNYIGLMALMGQDRYDIIAHLKGLANRFGVQLDGGDVLGPICSGS